MIITFPADKLDSEKFNFRSEQGNFLIGSENTWHGGIHIEGKDIGIKAITDGRIISYRFEEAYKEITKNKGKDSEYVSKYSNCFIIMQHDLTYVKHILKNKGKENETTEKKEENITFYSLYNHLLPLNAYSDKNTSKNVKFPPFLAKKEYQTATAQKIKGLGVYKFEQNEKTKKFKKLKDTEVVLPVNTEFTLADDSKKENTIVLSYKRNGKTKTSRYKKLAPFKDLNGEDCTDYYANVNSGISKKLTPTTYKATFKKDTSKIEGVPVYNNPSRNAPVIKVLKSNQSLQTEGEVKNGFIAIKGTNEFVNLKHLKTVHTLDESKFKKNEIVACDIPIKAKTYLGYTGLKQSRTNKSYYVCHHEIFMAANNDDKIKSFLNHTFDIYSEEENPLNKKKYYKLPKDSTIYKTLKVPDNPTLKAKTPVKVIAKKGKFCKVKILKSVERTVEKGALFVNATQSKGKKIVYDIINFDYISKIFDGTVTKKDTLTHVSDVKNTLVKVRLEPQEQAIDYDFWIPISDLSQNYEYKTESNPTQVFKSIRDAESVTNYVMSPKKESKEFEWLKFDFKRDILGIDDDNDSSPKEVGRKNVTKKTYTKEIEKEVSGVVERSLMKTTDGKLIKWTKNDPKQHRHHYPVNPKNTPKFKEINAAFNGKLSLTEVSHLFSNGSFYCNKNGAKGDKNSLYRGLTYVYKEKEKAPIVPNIVHEDENVIQAILPVEVYKKFEISETNYKILPVDNTGKDPKVHEDVDTLFAFFENKLPNVSGFELKWKGACNEKGDKVSSTNRAATHRIVAFDIQEFNEKQKVQSHTLQGGYTPKVGDEVGLVKDVKDLWLARPDNKEDVDFLLEKPTVVKLTNEKDIILVEENGDFHYKQVETHNLYLGNENEKKQKGWVKSSELKKDQFFSPYNWEQFGFNVLDGGDEYIYEIKDSQDFTKTKSEFIKKIWSNFNIMDHVINVDEVRFALGVNEVRYEMSRIVAKHQNEWDYTYEEIKSDVEKFYDAQINFAKKNKQEQSVIDEMENLKQEYLSNLEQQVTDLMFWNDAANATYQQDTPEVKETTTSNKRDFGITDQDRVMNKGSVTTTTESTTTLSKPIETKQAKSKQPERIFPADSTVYHFHPIAFVNQMKLMLGNGGSCPRCSANFTYEQIKEVFPAAAKNETLAKQLVDELNLIREEYGIDTCQKKAHLIAQFGSETGFNTLVEDLKSYTAENLIKTFGYFTRNPNEAKKYVGNTKAIAERVYGLRKVDKESDIVTCVGLSKKERKTKKCNDLGNKNMADGYKFIGRGLIQLTGRYHYENINKEFQKAFPNQGDLIANPELLEQPKYAVMSAMSYWINKGLNKLANDGGYENVDKITSIINKYTDSKAKRKSHYIDAYYAFKLFNCELLTDEDSTKPDTNLKIKEGLSWAEGLAITEAQLRANPNTPYIVNYKQESGSEVHLRTEQTEAGKAKMDCSELVCRYLQKIEWSTDVKYITSRGFVDYAAQHPEKFRVNDGDPKTGDVFAWKGHTGIVKSYDPATKKVVTIESISEQSYSWHKGIHFKGVVIWEYDKDKNHLKSKDSKIVRYYTPKKHYSE